MNIFCYRNGICVLQAAFFSRGVDGYRIWGRNAHGELFRFRNTDALLKHYTRNAPADVYITD